MADRAWLTRLSAHGGRLHGDGTGAMLLGSLGAGLGAYLFQVVGSRSVGEAAFAPVTVIWTIQYLMLSVVLYPVEAFVTRAEVLAAAAGRPSPSMVRALAPPLSALAGLVVALAWVGRNQLFDTQAAAVPVVASVVSTYAAFVVVRGRLAGARRFSDYGAATAAESFVRLALVIPVALVSPTPMALAWTMPTGALAVSLWWELRGRRRAGAAHRPARALLPSMPSYLASTGVANGVAHFLLAGSPLVLSLAGAAPRETSIMFVTITAARLPLVVVQGGVLSRITPPLVRFATAGDDAAVARAVRGVAVAGAGVAAAVGVAAFVVGPTAIAVLFGAGFRPSPALVAAAAAGVVLGTASLILNQIAIATGRERLLPVAWVVALASAAVAFAVAGDSVTDRVLVGFLVGELVALFAIAGALRRAPALAPAGAPLPATP